MKFQKTPVNGAILISLESFADDRGVFAEAFSKEKLRPQGIMFDVRLTNFSLTKKAGTVRGMHWQEKPFSQGKIVFSAHGRIFDAIVDVRPRSVTRGAVFCLELLPQANALYIPPGVAHGCQALEDQAMLVYLLDNVYKPSHERGLRPDDPDARIPWPLPMVNVASRDLAWPTLKNLEAEADEGEEVLPKCDSCGGEMHCHCDRDADGRCEKCTRILGEMVAIMTKISKVSRDQMTEELDGLDAMCEICRRETSDYMLAKILRDFGAMDSEFARSDIFPYFVQAVQAGRSMLSESQGVTSWPLLDKAVEDVNRAMRDKDLESPDGP